ncbi:MAG: U32 family peptidase C-terminal domain-containing protein [Alphaproteobacteria bacterium]|nr:U32 family peptidase C-terminal domain-containing protein [Alphaproteobacteria bacterium]
MIDSSKKPELLLPAGSLERLKTAFLYGADAVYAGMPAVSLRNKTSFTTDEMKAGIDYAHRLGKKVYLTVNLFTHDSDIPKLDAFINHLSDLKPDGVIVADPGVFELFKQRLPDLPRHISTQANVCSSLTVGFWQKQGASLCVLGREVSLPELTEIRRKCPDIRLEMFIHGALCISYSGRCLLSNFMTGRSANKGNCAHTCRWRYRVYANRPEHPQKDINYYLEEENRPGQFFPIDEDEHGTYVMNSRDLCLLPRLNDILPIGIDSFKIEGRNKSEYYTAVTARAYRRAIDDWFKSPESWQPDSYMAELMTLQSRGYTVGFLDGNAGPEAQSYDVSGSFGNWHYAGVVRGQKTNRLIVEVKDKIETGMVLEALSPYQFEPIRLPIQALYDVHTGLTVDSISAGRIGQMIEIEVKNDILSLLPNLSVLRLKCLNSPE